MTALAVRFRFARSGYGKVGLAGSLFLLALIVIGPIFAPHDPAGIVGLPLQRPSGQFLLGTDGLGRDVLSRILWGGRSIVGLAVLATALAYLVGASIGLLAGYTRSIVDPLLMRAMDVLLAVPPLLFLLVLATGAGRSLVVLVLGVATVHVPSIARIVRAATQEVAVRGYVEAAVARPAADWALMISENRGGITLQPWAVAVPALLIAFLTVAVNLVADAVARSLGTSTDRKRVAR